MQKTGSEVVPIDWRLEKSDGIRLTFKAPGEISICHTDHSLDTQRWHYRLLGEGTDVSAVRQGKEIHFSGALNGQQVRKQIAIGEEPWYQSTSLSLRPLALSDRTDETFWTIRTDNLDLHKLRAERIGEEMATLAGESVLTVKVKLAPTGLKSFFWHGYYWFRASDGAFVRYESPTAPPGPPTTRILLDPPR